MQKNKTAFSLSLITIALMSSSSIYAQEVSTDDVAKSTQINQQTKVESIGNSDDEIERIEVSGSRLITDPTLTTRNLTIINKEEIDRSGVNSLQELLERLPQNVGSTNNTGSGLGINQQSLGLGPNVYGGSSVNLRGLGAQYTLILINGRRPAKGGLFGDITDISTIPLERVEHIEVLFDGAAAIYGSDAIGGVINIVTRQDYDGTEVSVQIDDTSDGGGATKSFSIGHTFDLDNGSFSVNTNYSKTESINTRQRDLDYLGAIVQSLPPQPNGVVGNGQTEIMWVRDVNGDGDYDDAELDERLASNVIYSIDDGFGVFDSPISRRGLTPEQLDYEAFYLTPEQQAAIDATPNPESIGYTPVYYAALPPYSNQQLSLYDVIYNLPAGASAEEQFLALGESSVANAGQALTPEVEQYSIGVDFDYELTDDLTFRLSSSVGRTTSKSEQRPAGENLIVPSLSVSNPFNTLLNYAIDSGLPQEKLKTTSDSFNTALTLEWKLSEDWETQLNASYSKLENQTIEKNALHRGNTIHLLDPNDVTSYQGTLQGRLFGSDTLSFFDKNGDFSQIFIEHDDVHFNDPLLGFNSTDELVSALINPFHKTNTDSSTQELEFYLQGRLMTLPGGDVTTNFILAHTEEQVIIGNNSDSLSINNVLPGNFLKALDREFTTKVKSIASEISIPIIGDANKMTLINSLSLHGAARIEDVNYFDKNANNWSLGMNYQPNDWITVRMNRSASTALPSPQLALGGVDFQISNEVLNCADCSNYTTIAENIFSIGGATDNLGPEENDNFQLGLQFFFSENVTFSSTYSDSKTTKQVGTPGISSSTLTLEALSNVDETPYFRTVTPETIVFDQPFVDYALEDSFGGLVSPQEGDYLVDQRNFNIRSTHVKSIDFSLDLRSGATAYGEFFLKWSHNRTLEHEVIQNTLCNSGSDDCEFNLEFSDVDSFLGTPIDLVGSLNREQFQSFGFLASQQPIPRDSGRVSLDWGYEGLTVGLSTNYRSSVELFNTDFVTDYDTFEDTAYPFKVRTTPALGLDLNISYEFNSGMFTTTDWLDNTTLYFSVNDLIRRDEKIEVIYLDTPPPEDPFFVSNAEFNAAAIEPRGTYYSLRLRKTF